MQKQLLLTHLCLPGASLCDFYSWLMQYFKLIQLSRGFWTGWYFWTLTVGRLISQLTRTAPHNIIYIKQGLISIRALLWAFRLFGLYLLWARQNTWISLTQVNGEKQILQLSALAGFPWPSAGNSCAGRQNNLTFAFQLVSYPRCFEHFEISFNKFHTASIFPVWVSVLQHQSFVLCLVTSWQVFLWERFGYSESLWSWKKSVFGLTHAASILSGRRISVFPSTRQCSGVLTLRFWKISVIQLNTWEVFIHLK